MKILIVQIGRYGDMVLTTPLFSEIHRVYPDAQIDFLCSKQNYQIIEGNPHIRRIWIHEKGLKTPKLIFSLRAEKYDVWLDPKDHFSNEGTLLARISNARMKIGWNGDGSGAFTHPVNQADNSKLHRVETNLASLAQLGITTLAGVQPELFPPKDSEHFAEQFLAQIDKPVVINISAGDESRYLPLEIWREVCNSITHPIVLNFSPKDATLAREVQSGITAINLYPSRNIMDTVSLIKRARMLISPDTAVIHIASAFDVPTLGLYSKIEWNYNRFHPLSSQSIVVQPDEGKTLSELSSNKILEGLEQFAL